MLLLFFTPVPATEGLPGQIEAGPQPWQGCSSRFSCTLRCHTALPSQLPPEKQNIPFLGNLKSDPTCTGLGEPDTNSTWAKTQQAATAEVNSFPQTPLQLQSLLLQQLQTERCCLRVSCKGSFPGPRANRRAQSPSFAEQQWSRARPTQAVPEKWLRRALK